MGGILVFGVFRDSAAQEPALFDECMVDERLVMMCSTACLVSLFSDCEMDRGIRVSEMHAGSNGNISLSNLTDSTLNKRLGPRRGSDLFVVIAVTASMLASLIDSRTETSAILCIFCSKDRSRWCQGRPLPVSDPFHGKRSTPWPSTKCGEMVHCGIFLCLHSLSEADEIST